MKTKSAGECVNSVNDVNICDSVDDNVGDFMYMDVLINGTKVAALLDTGSSTCKNIISNFCMRNYLHRINQVFSHAANRQSNWPIISLFVFSVHPGS